MAQAAVSQTATDASRNEVTGQPVTSGGREVTVGFGGDTRTSTVRAVRIPERIRLLRGFVSGRSGSRKLYINIILGTEDRADYEYKVIEQGDVSKYYIRHLGVGDALWIYEDFGGYPLLGFHTAYRPAGSGASASTTVGGAFDRRWGIPYASFDDHRGYRQPAIGRTVLDFDSLNRWD